MRNRVNKVRRALVVGLAAASIAGTVFAHEQVVKIGVAGPLTGTLAQVGIDIEHAVQIAVEEANAKKLTIGGRPIKFTMVSEDDQADPKTGAAVAQRMVDSKVAAVIGHYNSGVSIPASRIYADGKIPQIAAGSTNPMLTRQGIKSVFRVLNDDAVLGQYAGTYVVKDLKAQRIALIDDRTAYGQGLADEVIKAIKAANGNVVLREYTNDKATDFNSILTSAKAANVDLVFFVGLYHQVAPMIKQMKNLGLKAQFMNIGNLPNSEFAKMAGSAAEGIYAWSPGMPLQNMPRGVEFDKKLRDKFSVGVMQYSPFAYDAAWTAINAMIKADSVEPSKFLPALKNINYDGVTGTIAFTDSGELKNAGASVFQFKGGKWNLLTTKRSE